MVRFRWSLLVFVIHAVALVQGQAENQPAFTSITPNALVQVHIVTKLNMVRGSFEVPNMLSLVSFPFNTYKFLICKSDSQLLETGNYFVFHTLVDLHVTCYMLIHFVR